MSIDSVGIIGGGAWGTALAQTMRRAGRDVTLWAREADVVASINERHVNETFLPGVTLDPGVRATDASRRRRRHAMRCCSSRRPSMFAPYRRRLRPSLRQGQPVVICAKGIEQSSGQMMGDIIAAELPEACTPRCRARALRPTWRAACRRRSPWPAPTKAWAGCSPSASAARMFRLYWTSDLVGVELGGALKNVLAIAAGIVDGQGLGASAHAALVTRGFAEMRRFGKALGARPETLIGLSGLGDLILTCGSPQSRNMSLGRALGRGETLAQALAGKLAVTEGVYTATAVCRIADEKGIDMPISAAVLRRHRRARERQGCHRAADAAAVQGRRLRVSSFPSSS